MKQLAHILILILSSNCFAQSFYLNINGINKKQNQAIDSTIYIRKHPNIRSLNNEILKATTKLEKRGYIDYKILENKKINDSTYNVLLDLKTRIKEVHIYIGINNFIYGSKKTANDSIIIPYTELENFLNQEISNKEKAGFSFSKIKLQNIKKKNSIIYADLNFYSDKKRTLNSVIVNYTNTTFKDFFPKGALKQLNKKYLNKTFNQETVKRLYEDINSYEFVSQTKYPEILFTPDSTKAYIYLDKRKANNFDGYIGFSNDENKKITLNGYLDISLTNILRAAEKFSLYWKSDGNQQKTFNANLEIPYLFQSSLGIKAQLNIFKQDSTFQNTQTAVNLGYYLNYNSKLYLGYQSTESSDIQNINNSIVSDFNNSYITSTYEYQKTDPSNSLMPKKAFLSSVIGFGKRETNNELDTANPSKQFYINLNAKYNFEFNSKNFININCQNFYLNSKNYISNELFRFGGMNSIRGFSENSLQANFYSAILTEYRYMFSKGAYIHSIADYAIYQDLTNISNPKKIKNLIGIGIGAGIQTKDGILRIILTNGQQNQQEIQLYNSIINICYNVKF